MDEVALSASGRSAAETDAVSPAPPPPRRLRPGRLWYWLALLILLGGMAWPLLGTRSTGMKIASLTRVALPRGGRVTLPHAGTFVVNYEAERASEHSVPAFSVRARPVTPFLKVSLRIDHSGYVYASGTTEGVAVVDLTVSGPGTVFLDGPGAPDVPGGSSLAIGSRLPGILITVLPGIGLMLLGIGGIVLVATLRSRGAVKRARYRALAP